AIQLPQSEWLIAAILAVLKTGAAYIPVDPEYPAQRIQHILQDSKAKLQIDQNILDHFQQTANQYQDDNRSVAIPPHALAYLIYTSGSTGQPKGVMIDHQSISQRLWGMADLLTTDEKLVTCLITNFVFDVSLLEIFLPLCFGGQLFIPSRDVVYQPAILLQQLSEKAVTQLQLTPSMLRHFLKAITPEVAETLSLQRVCIGGESLSEALVLATQERLPGVQLNNHYGPTEVTIDALVLQNIREFPRNCIGRPVPNSCVYILDESHQLVPIGAKGEICIGGQSLAQGYLNQAELSQQKFIPNPFREGERLYKSGDIGRWLPNGTIEFLGRQDDQVKIRGFRIELGEIETAIQQSGYVKANIVVASEDQQGQQQLVAYLIPQGTFDRTQLQMALKQRLPHYMIPPVMIELEEFPLSPNGKVDRQALPQPTTSSEATPNFIAPQHPVEVQLANIWKDLLPIESLSIRDNFFELGGDSIITIQVVSRARRYGHQLQARDLFAHQTIEELAIFLQQQQNQTLHGEQGILDGIALMLPIQQWFFEQDFAERSHYNQALLFEIHPSIQVTHLEQSITALMQQHDALRFTYQAQANGWTQEYGAHFASLQKAPLDHLSLVEAKATLPSLCQRYQESLNIEQGHLAQFVWIKMPAESQA
ncbi:MAG: amino acid adenylation domain-containing protein, partial [Bacteroidota bacterium]